MKEITQNFHKKYCLLCSKCNRLSNQSVSIFFDNSELAPDFNLELTNEYFCNNCGKITMQYDIDENIAMAVRLLNIHGFKTEFSCEGYWKNIRGEEFISTPYIRFSVFGGLQFEDFIRIGKCEKISPKEQSLNNIGWKFYHPGLLNGSSTDSSRSYDLKFNFDDDETRDLNEVFKEACENLYKVLLEILIDYDATNKDQNNQNLGPTHWLNSKYFNPAWYW